MPKEKLITKTEATLLGAALLFALIWMAVVTPYLGQSAWFQAQIPPVQFLIFEFGFIVGIICSLGFILSYSYFKLRRKNPSRFDFVFTAIKFGGSGWALNKLILDVWESPYYVSPSGVVLLDNPEALTSTAIDAVITWLGLQAGLSGFWLYFTVYIVFPMIVLAVIVLAFTWRKLLQMFGA